MMNQNTNQKIDRMLRAGVTAPALVLTILAGAAFAQQAGMSGRTYEVIIESADPPAPAARERADEADGVVAGSVTRARASGQDRRGSDASNARVVVEVRRVVDGQEIVVRRVNEHPIEVRIDGKSISKDHFKIKDGKVFVTEPGTDRVHELSLPSARGGAGNPFLGRLEIAEGQRLPQAVGGAGNLRWQAQAPAAPSQPRVMLGVVMVEPDPVVLEHLGLDAEKAVLLERVIEGLPADKAGLQVKDIIVGFGEHAEPRSAEDIRKVLAKAEPGSTVKVKVIRKGHPVTVDLKLEAFDGPALGRAAAPQTPPAPGEVRGGQAGQMWQRFGDDQFARLEREHADHDAAMERARRAMEEAAQMIAKLEHEAGDHARDAQRQASEAIKRAIEAMQQGDVVGFEIEEMRQIQQEAVERLRRELGDGNVQRFWAQPGDNVEGFALRFPGDADNGQRGLAERLERLETRLDDMEASMDRAIERLESRTEAMMERLIDRLERVLERESDERGR